MTDSFDASRRAVVLGVASVGSLGGCLRGLSPTTRPPEPSARRERAGLTAVVTDVSYVGTAGDDGAITGRFDCDAATATIEGRLSTSSCRTVSIRALSVGSQGHTARLVLVPRWDESSPPERTDCAGATYAYRVRLDATDGLPGEIQVVHERPDGAVVTRETLVRDC